MKVYSLPLLPLLNSALTFPLKQTERIPPIPCFNSPNQRIALSSFCHFGRANNDRRKLNSLTVCMSLNKEEEEDPWEQEEETGKRTVVTTSFGSESVPQEQRPTNEYLNLLQQPLFGWASQETGNVGLFQRLLVTYLAIFLLV